MPAKIQIDSLKEREMSMPNYLYKCTQCLYQRIFALPISFDPKKKFMCNGCNQTEMTRRIINPSSVTMKKGTLGEWFKNETGKEFMGE